VHLAPAFATALAGIRGRARDKDSIERNAISLFDMCR
jgi:hypothetical protein